MWDLKRYEEWREFISKIPKKVYDKIADRIHKSGKNPDSLLGVRDAGIVYLYHVKKMSCDEIVEKHKDFFLNRKGDTLSIRGIHRIVAGYGVNRTNRIAMAHRVKMGRMDYKNRDMNLCVRHIDYEKRWIKKKSGFEPRHRQILIRAPQLLQDMVRDIAGKYKKTITETLWLLLKATEDVNASYAARILYGIKYKQDVLRKRKINKPNNVYIILTGFDKYEVPLYIQEELMEEEKLRIEIEENNKKIYDMYIKQGKRWLVNVKDKIFEKGLNIESFAKEIKIDKGRLKLMLNNEIMAKPKDQKRIADFFNVNPEEIFSIDKIKIV